MVVVATVHDGMKEKLGDVVGMVMECCKGLIAHDIEVVMMHEYTEGAKSGIVEARLIVDGQCTCEYTGTKYNLSEVVDSRIEDIQHELAKNATRFHMISAFNQLDVKLGGPDDDTEYVFVADGQLGGPDEDNAYVLV